MRTLLIGLKEDLDIACQAVKKPEYIGDIIFWEKPEEVKVITSEYLCGFQLVVIAIKEEGLCSYIRQWLISVESTMAKKIISFYQVYQFSIPMQRVDAIMQNNKVSEYQGMILGISHAEVGIIAELFDVPFCNLAVSSQDLYYNLKTLEHCIKFYYHKIRKLKYLIIDMFDYSYFNYDVSLSNNALKYYSWGGFSSDPHHFDSNKNIEEGVDHAAALQFLRYCKSEGLTEELIGLWNQVFSNPYTANEYLEYTGWWHDLHKRYRCVDDKTLDQYKYDTAVTRNVFEDTIAENRVVFEQILKTAYMLNPEIMIYAIIIPRYEKAAKISEKIYEPWKKRFTEIIEEAQKNYKFRYIDFNEDEISKESAYYNDFSHLNYIGAIKFTGKLVEIIQKDL